jgi:hypothetical protein
MAAAEQQPLFERKVMTLLASGLELQPQDVKGQESLEIEILERELEL